MSYQISDVQAAEPAAYIPPKSVPKTNRCLNKRDKFCSAQKICSQIADVVSCGGMKLYNSRMSLLQELLHRWSIDDVKLRLVVNECDVEDEDDIESDDNTCTTTSGTDETPCVDEVGMGELSAQVSEPSAGDMHYVDDVEASDHDDDVCLLYTSPSPRD